MKEHRNIIIKVIVIIGLVCFLVPFVSVSCGIQEIKVSGFELMFPSVSGDSDLERLPENWILIAAFACGFATFFTVTMSEKQKGYAILPGITAGGILLSWVTAVAYYDLSETDMAIIQLDAGWWCTLLCFCLCVAFELFIDSEETASENGDGVLPVPTPKISSIRLLCLSGIYTEGEFSIAEGESLCVGRAPQMANIVFSEETISRKHCVFSLKGGQSTVTDFSSFGTYVNGERIKEGQPVVLRDSDKVKIGNNEFMILFD